MYHSARHEIQDHEQHEGCQHQRYPCQVYLLPCIEWVIVVQVFLHFVATAISGVNRVVSSCSLLSVQSKSWTRPNERDNASRTSRAVHSLSWSQFRRRRENGQRASSAMRYPFHLD